MHFVASRWYIYSHSESCLSAGHDQWRNCGTGIPWHSTVQMSFLCSVYDIKIWTSYVWSGQSTLKRLSVPMCDTPPMWLGMTKLNIYIYIYVLQLCVYIYMYVFTSIYMYVDYRISYIMSYTTSYIMSFIIPYITSYTYSLTPAGVNAQGSAGQRRAAQVSAVQVSAEQGSAEQGICLFWFW